MSTSPIPRSAGIGLLVYVIGTFAAFMFSGSPGGEYADARVGSYIDPGHAAAAIGLWYVAALSALALVPFAAGLRGLPSVGDRLATLTSIGAAVSVTGAFLSGGVAVAMAEGGSAVRSSVPHAVVYVLTEIGNLMAVCGPALCVGLVGVVLAFRGVRSGGLRALCAVGGVSGMLAPSFFTYFVYLLCALAAGIVLIARRRSTQVVTPGHAPSIV